MKQKKNSGRFSGRLKNELGTRQYYVNKDGEQAIRSPMSATGKREDAQITQFLKQGVTNKMYEILRWDKNEKRHWLRSYWEEDVTYRGHTKHVKRLCDQWRHANMTEDFPVPALTPEQYRADAMVVCPMKISEGRLHKIGVKDGVSDIAIGDLEIRIDTTIGELSQAIINHNTDWKTEDRLTWIWLKQEEKDGLPTVQNSRWIIELDECSDKKIWSTIGSIDGLISKNGYLATHIAREAGGFCWIHSGWREDSWRVSSQKLILGEDRQLYERYTSKEMWEKAAEAYRIEGQKRDQAKETTNKVELGLNSDAMLNAIRQAVYEGMKQALHEVMDEWKKKEG